MKNNLNPFDNSVYIKMLLEEQQTTPFSKEEREIKLKIERFEAINFN